MSTARSRAIATNIARAIVRNRTQKRFSSLHAEAIEETNMSKEIHATGEPTNGAAPTRGQSQKESTGTSDTKDFAVPSQVNVVIPPIERGNNR